MQNLVKFGSLLFVTEVGVSVDWAECEVGWAIETVWRVCHRESSFASRAGEYKGADYWERKWIRSAAPEVQWCQGITPFPFPASTLLMVRNLMVQLGIFWLIKDFVMFGTILLPQHFHFYVGCLTTKPLHVHVFLSSRQTFYLVMTHLPSVWQLS